MRTMIIEIESNPIQTIYTICNSKISTTLTSKIDKKSVYYTYPFAKCFFTIEVIIKLRHLR